MMQSFLNRSEPLVKRTAIVVGFNELQGLATKNFEKQKKSNKRMLKCF